VKTVTNFLVALKGGKFLEQPAGSFLKKKSGYYAIPVQETKKLFKTS
jgi:hypothetical protein